jgi:hypothetical protein
MKVLISSIVLTMLFGTTLHAICTVNIDMGMKIITSNHDPEANDGTEAQKDNQLVRRGYIRKVMIGNSSATDFNDTSLVTKKYVRDVLVGGAGTIKDVEGNVYKTAKFGHQTWMTENMRAIKYPNGSAIAHNWGDGTANYSRVATFGTTRICSTITPTM